VPPPQFRPDDRPTSEAAGAKIALRDQIRTARNRLTVAELGSLGRGLAEVVTAHPDVRRAATVTAYVGVGMEPPTGALLDALSALGKRGETIVRAREQVLDILQRGNACAAWFQQADPDPAEVFRSLHFELEVGEPRYVYGMRDSERGQILKHPWAAKSIESGGPNSTILLNASGPFFNRTSLVMQLDPRGMLARPDGKRPLTVSSYDGNTPEAQITILLHELGHIIGRLPEDGDSLDGRSSRNTSEVLRHCKTETRAAAHNSPRGSI